MHTHKYVYTSVTVLFTSRSQQVLASLCSYATWLPHMPSTYMHVHAALRTVHAACVYNIAFVCYIVIIVSISLCSHQYTSLVWPYLVR